MALDYTAQRVVSAIDAVADYPGAGHAGGERTIQHGASQLGLGREGDRRGHAGRRAALAVGGPVFRQVECPADQRLAVAAGIGEKDPDLAVLDAPRSAGILALHAAGLITLFQEASFVEHQHRLLIAQMLDHISAQIVAHQLGLPMRPGQKVLHPVRRAVACHLSQLPAVLTLRRRQQATQICPRPPTWLDPPKARPDPLHYFLESLRPVLCIHGDHPRYLLIPRLTQTPAVVLEEIKDELLEGRDLSKKGSHKRQLEYAERTARKAIEQLL